MQTLEGLRWEAGIAFDAHGARVGVRVADAGDLPLVESVLPPGWGPAPSPVVDSLYSLAVGSPPHGEGRLYVLYRESTEVARTLDIDELRAALLESLQEAVALLATERVFVRGGAAGWKGRALLLPGARGAGITTLLDALAARGATVLSDRYAVVDGHGRVHAHKRSTDGASPTVSLPVALVAHTWFDARADWRPTRLSPGSGLLHVLGHTVVARTDPDLALPFLAPALQGADVLAGPRGEAAETAARLQRALDGVAAGEPK